MPGTAVVVLQQYCSCTATATATGSTPGRVDGAAQQPAQPHPALARALASSCAGPVYAAPTSSSSNQC